MRSGRQILLDLLLNFVVYSNGNTVLDLNQLAILIAMGLSQDLTGLLVNDLLYALAVLVLAGNLGGNFNSFEVILLFTARAISPSTIFCTSLALASVVTILPLLITAVT